MSLKMSHFKQVYFLYLKVFSGHLAVSDFPHTYTEWEDIGRQEINLLEISYFFVLSKAKRNVAASTSLSK